MMNRKERRGYLSRMRNDQAACFCPLCKRKTRHYTQPSKDGNESVDIVCEYCDKVVRAGVSGLPPFVFVRVKGEQYDG